MHAHKLSISLPQRLYEFVESYQKAHHCKTRSAVISEALYLLQQEQLKMHYREASQETQETDEAFDITTADGIEDEAW